MKIILFVMNAPVHSEELPTTNPVLWPICIYKALCLSLLPSFHPKQKVADYSVQSIALE